MAQLFFDPKGAAVTIGSTDAGQAMAASISITRTTTTYKEWDAANCLEVESAPKIIGLKGELTLELLSGADVAVMAVALFGGSVTSNTLTIGSAAMAEYAVTVVVKNAAASCGTWTYSFPRCQLADQQEHIFGVASDTTDPTPQSIAFTVLPIEGTFSLGTVTKA